MLKQVESWGDIFYFYNHTYVKFGAMQWAAEITYLSFITAPPQTGRILPLSIDSKQLWKDQMLNLVL